MKSSKASLISQQDHLKKQIKSLHRGTKSELEEEIRNFETEVKAKGKEIVEVSLQLVFY